MTEAAELKPEEVVRNSCDSILFHSWIRTGEERKVDDNFICGDILVGIGYYWEYEEVCEDSGDTRWVRDVHG